MMRHYLPLYRTSARSQPIATAVLYIMIISARFPSFPNCLGDMGISFEVPCLADHRF